MGLRQGDYRAERRDCALLYEARLAEHDANVLSCEAPRQRDCGAALDGCASSYVVRIVGESFAEG